MGMKDGECPECGSEDIRASKGSLEGVYVFMVFPLPINVLACADCGYVATFVPSDEIDYVRKHWKPAEKRKNDE